MEDGGECWKMERGVKGRKEAVKHRKRDGVQTEALENGVRQGERHEVHTEALRDGQRHWRTGRCIGGQIEAF